MGQLTVLLERMHAGDTRARETLFSTAYAELHRLAQARLRSHRGNRPQLDTTSLVHESYLRFLSTRELRPEDRRSFFAYASKVMRSVIVDSVRVQLAKKRGGGWASLTLSTDLVSNLTNDEEMVIRVHEALDVLERTEPRLAQIAQMRYFGGYSSEEIADTLGVTSRTVQREWEKARLILAAELS